MAEIKNKSNKSNKKEFQTVLAYQNKKYLIDTEDGRNDLKNEHPEIFAKVFPEKVEEKQEPKKEAPKKQATKKTAKK